MKPADPSPYVHRHSLTHSFTVTNSQSFAVTLSQRYSHSLPFISLPSQSHSSHSHSHTHTHTHTHTQILKKTLFLMSVVQLIYFPSFTCCYGGLRGTKSTIAYKRQLC